MNPKTMTTKQILILLAAALAEFIWICLPGYVITIVAGIYGAPTDGALGKEYGFLLLLALTAAVTLLWAPTALKVSGPLIKKLAKRIGATRDKEE